MAIAYTPLSTTLLALRKEYPMSTSIAFFSACFAGYIGTKSSITIFNTDTYLGYALVFFISSISWIVTVSRTKHLQSNVIASEI